MKRLLSNLAGGLPLHQSLVADHGLVCNRPAHVVHSAAARDGGTASAFVREDVLGDESDTPVQQQRDVRLTEHPSLSVSLGEEADDLVAPGAVTGSRDHRFVDVLRCDQIEDDRHQPCVLDPLLATGWIVHRHSHPEDLANSKSTHRRVEPSVEFVDLVGQKAGDRGSKDAGKLGVKQMAKRAVERLSGARVEGLPGWRW